MWATIPMTHPPTGTLTSTLTGILAHGVADPVGIERDEARRRAATELLDPKYEQESLADRFLRVVQQFIGDLTDAVASGDGGVLALVALFVIIGGLIALLLWHARRATRRSAATGASIFADEELSAAEHRAAAERFAASGEWAQAIRERLRAIARDLQERAILDASPGRTADELAAAAGRELPSLAGELAAGARLFDDVTYGDRPGTADGYARLARLDEQVAAARPAVEAAPR